MPLYTCVTEVSGRSFVTVSSVDPDSPNENYDMIEGNSFHIPIPVGCSTESAENIIRNVLANGGATVVMR